jgi:hypothetical protein
MYLQDEVSVTMTHTVMKILAEHLSASVAIVEKEFGPIKVPKAARVTEEMRSAILLALRSTPLVT